MQPLEKAEYNGNFLLNDFGAGGTGHFAFISGLAENQKPRLDAVSMKFHGDTSHGYRFVLRKRADTQSYVGVMNHQWTYSLTNLRLDIFPVANGLKPAESQIPVDLPTERAQAQRLTAVAFRGLMTCDSALRFRPDDWITHAELAHALSQSTHLHATTPEITRIVDIDWNTLDGEAIHSVVAAGLLGLDERQQFRPQLAASPRDVSSSLRKLALLDRDEVDNDLAKRLAVIEKSALGGVPRAKVAELLHEILRLPE